jgi:hypothetical protein
MEQFLSEHGVDICLNETHLVAERALRFANYVCYRTDWPTPGEGTAILVHKGIDHYSVPLSGLQYLEATAIHLVLATRPMKLVSAYLAPTQPLIESDLTECLSGGIPVLMAGDLNAKHKDWNSRLTTARGDSWYASKPGLTWSADVNQVRKTAAQRLGMLGPLLKRRSGLFVRNGVLLYKQLIRPMMDYACPIWRSAARSHVRKLLVLQSKCLRIATTAPWYVGNSKFTRIWGFHSSPTTSEHWPRVLTRRWLMRGTP